MDRQTVDTLLGHGLCLKNIQKWTADLGNKTAESQIIALSEETTHKSDDYVLDPLRVGPWEMRTDVQGRSHSVLARGAGREKGGAGGRDFKAPKERLGVTARVTALIVEMVCGCTYITRLTKLYTLNM